MLTDADNIRYLCGINHKIRTVKTNLTHIAALLLSASAAWGCVKAPDMGNPTGGGETGKVSELNVPSGFEWNTTENVVCDIASPHATRIALSTGGDLQPFAILAVGDDEPLSLSIPSCLKSVYISYETGSGFSQAVPVEVTAGKIAFSVPADSKPLVRGNAVGGAPRPANDDYSEISGGVVFYPATSQGWGTLMFEDLWPAYGDYDFNDFVVNYKIQLYMNNRNMVREMVVGLRTKAIGGSLPNNLYLRMTGVKGGEIDVIEKLQGINDPDDAQLVQLNPGNPVKDAALFRFDGIKKNGHLPQGSVYLNTERGYEIPENDLLQASFYIELRNSVKLSDLSFDSFDFFIARPYGEESSRLLEIHRAGYEPTAYGEDAYAELSQGVNTDYSFRPYCSNTNLVWALNIPANIPHVYENTDFIAAYPNFAVWAASGGTACKDWYVNASGNRVSDLLVK